MARITDSGIANEAMRRRLPKGFSETPYRKYFFDCRSSDCDRVLSVRFNKGERFGDDPKLRICVIFDNDIGNVSDDLRPIILDVHAIDGTEIWFAKHNKEWMYSVGIGKKYEICRRAEKFALEYIETNFGVELAGWEIENIDIYTPDDIVKYIQRCEYPFI